MNKRGVRRNGRGQIISYEIDGASDSNVDSQIYGDVTLASDDNNYSSTIKHDLIQRSSRPFFNSDQQPISVSYETYTDVEFSDEFINEVDIKEPRDVFAVFTFQSLVRNINQGAVGPTAGPTDPQGTTGPTTGFGSTTPTTGFGSTGPGRPSPTPSPSGPSGGGFKGGL